MEQSLKTIQNRLFYINKIVVDLQDFAKNLKPNIEKINFHEIVKNQLHELSIPENVKVRVSIETNFPELNLDRSYLERILTNLLMNSFQAMPDGGEITISAILRDNNALMSIKDTGIGISKSSQKKIFTPLFTTKSKGQGFGLAVVKKLTEAMNGSISFESEVDKGSQFTLEFPLERKKE
ncbi:MAG: ATP-binding protein [Candidatus Bathyarchaeota archaeon]